MLLLYASRDIVFHLIVFVTLIRFLVVNKPNTDLKASKILYVIVVITVLLKIWLLSDGKVSCYTDSTFSQ